MLWISVYRFRRCEGGVRRSWNKKVYDKKVWKKRTSKAPGAGKRAKAISNGPSGGKRSRARQWFREIKTLIHVRWGLRLSVQPPLASPTDFPSTPEPLNVEPKKELESRARAGTENKENRVTERQCPQVPPTENRWSRERRGKATPTGK